MDLLSHVCVFLLAAVKVSLEDKHPEGLFCKIMEVSHNFYIRFLAKILEIF
jgi:hypothetical protein